MKNGFKMINRNKRSTLGVVLAIAVLFLQPISASAFQLCAGSQVSIEAKLCRCCPAGASTHTSTVPMRGGAIKNGHCKATKSEASQKLETESFRQMVSAINGSQTANLFPAQTVCCEVGKAKREVTDSTPSLPSPDLVVEPSTSVDSHSLDPPDIRLGTSHPRSRPVYLILSSFLI